MGSRARASRWMAPTPRQPRPPQAPTTKVPTAFYTFTGLRRVVSAIRSPSPGRLDAGHQRCRAKQAAGGRHDDEFAVDMASRTCRDCRTTTRARGRRPAGPPARPDPARHRILETTKERPGRMIKGLKWRPHESTQTGPWLAATFPNLFGLSDGEATIWPARTMPSVASFFQSRFRHEGPEARRPGAGNATGQRLRAQRDAQPPHPGRHPVRLNGRRGWVGGRRRTNDVGTNGADLRAWRRQRHGGDGHLLAADAQAVHRGVLYKPATPPRRTKANPKSSGPINHGGGL